MLWTGEHRKQVIKFIVAAGLLAVASFALLSFHHSGYFFPRLAGRESQRFSQEVVYQGWKHHIELDGELLTTTGNDPHIHIFPDPAYMGNILTVSISRLSENQVNAWVLLAHEGEELTGANVVSFTISNGRNTVELPGRGYARIRLDIARVPGISMVIDEVVLANYVPLPGVFWLGFLALLAVCAAACCLVFFKPGVLRIPASPRENVLPERKLDWVMCGLAALLVPSIFLFDLYNRNRVQNHLPFAPTLVVAAVLALVSAVLFLLLRWFTRSVESALIVTVLGWVAFWLFEATYAAVSEALSRVVWLGLLGAALAVVSVCLRLYRPPFDKARAVFRILAATACVLFLFNFAPAVQHQIVLARGRAWEGERIFYIKRDFNVDPTLPSPDIYWFFMDGMMSLEMLEQFFGECQNHLRQELRNRNFIINEDAKLNAGGTTTAMMTLFFPSFYDSYWGARLEEVKLLIGPQRYIPLMNRLSEDGIDRVADIIPYNELFRALSAAGYNTALIASGGGNYVYTEVPADFFYDMSNVNFPLGILDDDFELIGGLWERFWFVSGSVFELLTLSTPFSVLEPIMPPFQSGRRWLSVCEHREIVDVLTFNTIDTWSERMKYRMLFDSFSISSPKLVFVVNFFAHGGFWWLHDPVLSEMDLTRIDLYVQAYNYAVIVMLNKIDLILEQNPNAVIVLQADHGMHNSISHDALRDLGWTEEEVRRQNFSTFSAVRIPPAYGGLDAPLHPLNITRELVNRFVGENYELLPSRER